MDNDDKKIKKAFIASVIALIVVGIVFVVTMCVSLSQIGRETDTHAKKYDLDCLTRPIDKPLTECI
jgi:hypothetical protein